MRTLKINILLIIVCSTSALAAAESSSGTFGLTLLGRAQPYLATPDGVGYGVNPATLMLEIPDRKVDMTLDAKASSLVMPSSLTGTYTLKLFSRHHEETSVKITYTDGVRRERLRLRAFVHGTATSYQFTLDPSAPKTINIPAQWMPPINLVPSPYGSADPATKLQWEQGNSGSVGFNVYGRRLDEPKLSYLGSSSVTSFLTNNPWDDSPDKPTFVYAVASINADGTESFLSDLAENNDRDQDGVTDEVELAQGLSPDSPDTDGDGLGDGQEASFMTSALVPDSDGDGFNDGLEVQYKSDPLDPSSIPILNKTPIANAGGNRDVRVNSLVTLDGSGSSDPDNAPQPLSYAWAQSAGPLVKLNGASLAKPTFTPTSVGSYSFDLRVSDGTANSDPAVVVITVPKLGDVDGDGDVDNNDLNQILAARNKPANGPNDLRDLDGNMVIDALDARRLTTLCTRPRCATQ